MDRSGTVPGRLSVAGLQLVALVVASVASPVFAQQAEPRPRPLGGNLAAPEGSKKHSLEPALKLAREARDAAAKLDDYEATFSKKELVGRQVIPLTMNIKFRSKPFSVYLWFHQPHEGREVIYVEGRNSGRLLAHETGIKAIAGTLSLIPTSADAMAEGRYPVTRFGMEKMADGIVTLWENELKHEEPEVKFYPNAKLAGMECQVVESVHPTPKRQFAFHRTRLYVDKATGLPVRVEQNAFPSRAGTQPPIVEEYTYSNIRTNVGLGERDFDTRNPKYGF